MEGYVLPRHTIKDKLDEWANTLFVQTNTIRDYLKNGGENSCKDLDKIKMLQLCRMLLEDYYWHRVEITSSEITELFEKGDSIF